MANKTYKYTKLTKNEIRTIAGIFECLEYASCRQGLDLNKFIPSITIKEMQHLASKLRAREYCEEHEIRYESMTEDDFFNMSEWFADLHDRQMQEYLDSECDY